MNRWLDRTYWKYLFTDLKGREGKLRIILCRAAGHKQGRWVRVSQVDAIDPEYCCSECGDDFF